jgi:hypothetical protein
LDTDEHGFLGFKNQKTNQCESVLICVLLHCGLREKSIHPRKSMTAFANASGI